MQSLQIPLRGHEQAGYLILSQLLGRTSPLDLGAQTYSGPSSPEAEISEANVYRFKASVPRRIVDIQPAELFEFDDEHKDTGRLVSGESVGLVVIALTLDDGSVLRGSVNVRPAKLSDDTAFRAMLKDLAELSVEALHQGFAPAAGQFSSEVGNPKLLYQRFAVMHAFLFDRDIGASLDHILAEPHRSWELEAEMIAFGRPLGGSSKLARSLVGPGPRIARQLSHLSSVPESLRIDRARHSFDTVPNRYLKFALNAWRMLAGDVLEAAESLGGSAKRRGIAEAERAVNRLDELLAAPLFLQVGSLQTFPQGNTVLARRDGYRQIAAAAYVVDSSLGLELDLDDPFLVSRKSIATLYEYWVFVRLAQVVATACESSMNIALFEIGRSGMSLVLRRGRVHRLKFEAIVGDRRLLVDLFFNRSFGSGQSWTAQMRPDASLLIRVADSVRAETDQWLHFDAKYRFDGAQFADYKPADAGSSDQLSKRIDLLKMHAYRDAIRESSAAYVLFPGSAVSEFRYDQAELLPGLGAFPMRPDHSDEDSLRLLQFLARAFDHIANRASRHTRARYWQEKSYSGGSTSRSWGSSLTFDRPPADTPVLCGYVRSSLHRRWIQSNGLYNIRSGDRAGGIHLDGPELAPELILLYGPDGIVPELFARVSGWVASSGAELVGRGYPEPRGDHYLLAEVAQLDGQPPWLRNLAPALLRPASLRFGAPFTVSWLDLALSLDD